jgi:hypothetical protein
MLSGMNVLFEMMYSAKKSHSFTGSLPLTTLQSTEIINFGSGVNFVEDCPASILNSAR